MTATETSWVTASGTTWMTAVDLLSFNDSQSTFYEDSLLSTSARLVEQGNQNSSIVSTTGVFRKLRNQGVNLLLWRSEP
jgi:hypothetical protein